MITEEQNVQLRTLIIDWSWAPLRDQERLKRELFAFIDSLTERAEPIPPKAPLPETMVTDHGLENVDPGRADTGEPDDFVASPPQLRDPVRYQAHRAAPSERQDGARLRADGSWEQS